MLQNASVFASATESPRRSTSRPGTVLVVEDDPGLLSLAAYVFGKEGYHVLTDVDAFGAQSLLVSHSVDLLFTDIDLAHGTSGVTLARDARALRSDLPIPLAESIFRRIRWCRDRCSFQSLIGWRR